jgi:hypothetical protein
LLSIGITICDKDYKLCENLLKQISEKVKIEHEVIIIDNREQFAAEETSWTPTYSFGYNAYQFSARAKIIELAKGDYIWFIDGDDDIRKIDSFDWTEDIITFSYSTYPIGDVHIKDDLITQNVFSYDTSVIIRPVLWNKFIKKSLFTDEFINKYRDLKIVTNEDVIWCYEALRHAASVRVVDKIIYNHNLGLSNKQNTFSEEDLIEITTGYNKMTEVLREVISDEEFFKKSFADTCYHIMSFIPLVKNVYKALDYMMEIIPLDYFKDSLFVSVYPQLKSSEQHKRIVKHLLDKVGEELVYKKCVEKVVYADGREEEIEFYQKIDFEK